MWLIDSNIIIYYLSANHQAIDFIKQHQGQMAISILTVMEVLSYPYDEIKLLRVERFLRKNFIWLGIDDTIIFKTASLRRIKKTKSMDALIASTALVHDLTLVTRNAKDFHHLPITLINPIDQPFH